MGYSEADTRSKLIDPALFSRGWTEDNICREETIGTIEIVNGHPKRRPKGRIDYTLRIQVGGPNSEPIALSLIEAKAEDLPPTQGLEQAKAYAKSKLFNVPFVFSTNGHLFVEYNRFTGLTSQPKLMSEFPTQKDLRERFEEYKGFKLDDEKAKPLLISYTSGEKNLGIIKMLPFVQYSKR